MKYTFSDEEDPGSDSLSTRRSNRQSGISTPAEHAGPTFTASGRQVKSRHSGVHGEYHANKPKDSSEQTNNGGLDGAADEEVKPASHGRSKRAPTENQNKAHVHPKKDRGDDDSTESMDDESDVTSSGGEWQGGDDNESDDLIEDEEDDEDDDIRMGDDEDPQQRLVVSLRYLKSHSGPLSQDSSSNRNMPNDLDMPSIKTFHPEIERKGSDAGVWSPTTQRAVVESLRDNSEHIAPRSPVKNQTQIHPD